MGTTRVLNYKGKGEHSVFQLEELVEHYKEKCYQKQLKLQESEELLEKNKELIEACSRNNILQLLRDEEKIGNARFYCNDFDFADRLSKQLLKKIEHQNKV